MPNAIRANSILPATRTDIELHTADGLTLVGELATPADRPAVATIVCLHPLPTHGGMMDSHVYRKAAWRLPALAGVAVLRFNTRGTSSVRACGGHESHPRVSRSRSSARPGSPATSIASRSWGFTSSPPPWSSSASHRPLGAYDGGKAGCLFARFRRRRQTEWARTRAQCPAPQAGSPRLAAATPYGSPPALVRTTVHVQHLPRYLPGFCEIDNCVRDIVHV